mgnify:FL=1
MQASIGIDWGFSPNPAAMIMVVKTPEFIAIVEAVQRLGMLPSVIAREVESWIEKYFGNDGSILWRTKVPVYADAENPAANEELRKIGFDVIPVKFGSVKELIIENTNKYLEFERIRILPEHSELIKQLKGYCRDKNGKPVKRFDHLADAISCALAHFPFRNTYGVLDGLTTEERKSVLIKEF